MSKVFDVYSSYYDLLYRDKDYVAEAAYIENLLVRNGIKGRELLEFGSGTGIHGRLLAGLGYRVSGIERSPEMAVCSIPTEGLSIRVGDIRSTCMERKFDAVFSIFHVISYQVTNSDVVSTFNNAAAHLDAGGLFIFDFWYSPAVYTQKPEVRVKRLEGEDVRITRVAEPVSYPNENRIDIHYTIFARNTATGEYCELKEIHPMRHFSLPEIDLLAQGAGFELVQSEEFLTGEQPDEKTWGVCTVLRKKQLRNPD